MKKFVNALLIVLLVVTVVLVACAVFSSPENINGAVSLNLIWGYILLCTAIVAALGCACWGLIQNPAGLKSSLVSLVVVAAVILVSYFVSAGHDIQIVDLQSGGYFPHKDTVIAETGIWIALVAGAGAVLSAIYSEIANALK